MRDRAERWKLLFEGRAGPDRWDDLDDDERLDLLSVALRANRRITQAARLEVVDQLVRGDPAMAAETLERLTDGGLGVDQTIEQLVRVMITCRQWGEPGGDFDPVAYDQRLRRLPLPSSGLVEIVIEEVAAERRVLPYNELVAQVSDRLGDSSYDPVLDYVVELAMDDVSSMFGPLLWLSGSRIAHLPSLAAGIVLTHEVSESERATGRLDVAFDLGGFVALGEPTLADAFGAEDPTLWVDGNRHSWERWGGPDGWLDRFPAGSTIAVRVDVDEQVHIESLASPPDVAPEVVALLRSVYDEEVEEPEMPIAASLLVAAMLARDGTVLDLAQAPLAALCEAAGLERRGNEVAHGPELWRGAAQLQRMGRLYRLSDGDNDTPRRTLLVLAVCDNLTLGESVEAAAIGEALDALTDEDTLAMVSEELFRDGVDPQPTPELFEQLVAFAGNGPRGGGARYLAALHLEFSGELQAAYQQLELALAADPGLASVIDRLAWYASDRGDAPRAHALWRQLTGPSIEQSLGELEPFTKQRATLGRNERCWCGSGRKYKHCHLGTVEQAPLPDRVGWLCRKAVDYLERSGPTAMACAYEVATTIAGDDPDKLPGILETPVVLDLVLIEGRWFERFLADRGSLLPDDEALLAASWLTVDRSVHEVVNTRPGVGMRLRDLRSGDLIEVRERSVSRNVRAGMLICARPVPDGETHQLIGAVLMVPAGHEGYLLDILDHGDALDLAGWVHDRSLPPELRNREGEVLVQCETVVEIDDQAALLAHLGETYRTDEAGELWSEHHDLDDELVIRATLHLVDGRLAISANSQERLERILDRLAAAGLKVRVVSDERTPVDISAAPSGDGTLGLPNLSGLPGPPPGAIDEGVVEQVRDHLERRWCDESVPALAGFTPRAAAADPTRREQLERLIAGFERESVPDGAITMRPERLRSLLGL